MIRLNEIKMPLDVTDADLLNEASRRLQISKKNIKSVNIARRAIDARDKRDIFFVFSLDVELFDTSINVRRIKGMQTVSNLVEKKICKKAFNKSPIVVGSGPAGLFAALTLAEAGAKPIVLERGDDVDTRSMKISRFWISGELDENSNVQFGEGGAGTFSDGKLNTGTRDVRQRQVLEAFVSAGAPREILYLAKPHIGTDYLRNVVRNLRKKICSLGGQVLFNHKMCGLHIENRVITGVSAVNDDKFVHFETDHVILAIGHSARDTFAMLHSSGINMEQKAFSVGVRIEHPQELIDRVQYGKFAGHPSLGAADYKLSAHLPSGRSVYTFCMCPGGVVVAAASEAGGVCTNGMSYFARNCDNANSALLVGITPNDFSNDHPLAGIELQRKLERAAFTLGGGEYRAPVQRVCDFLNSTPSTSLGSVTPSYTRGVTPCDLSSLFPPDISSALRDGIIAFDRKLTGFAMPDAVLTGVESRSSSPVRIMRDGSCEANIKGLFPCGEGAGYAGGIMSAAVDGIRVAEVILK